MGAAYVPHDIQLNEHGVVIAKLHVTLLQDSTTIPAGAMAVDAAMGPADEGDVAALSEKAAAALKLSGPDPIYPWSARERHVQGDVTLRALISKQGSILDLEVISTPDDALTQSAMDGVRKYTYKPWTVNGKAVKVETTITVSYSFGY